MTRGEYGFILSPGMRQALDIGKALRTARGAAPAEKHRDQQGFAAAIGASQGHLSRLENGHGAPSIDLLLRAAGVAGMRLSDLIALGEREGSA